MDPQGADSLHLARGISVFCVRHVPPTQFANNATAIICGRVRLWTPPARVAAAVVWVPPVDSGSELVSTNHWHTMIVQVEAALCV